MLKNEKQFYNSSYKQYIDMICDYCGKEYSVIKESYINTHKTFEKDACKEHKWEREKDKRKSICGSDRPEDYFPFVGKSINGLKERISYNEAIQLVEEWGMIPLFSEEDVLNSSSELAYICPNHIEEGIQSRTYSKIKHRSTIGICKYCNKDIISNKFNYKYKFVDEKFKEKDCLLLTGEYHNCYDELEYICIKHIKMGIQTTSFSCVRRNGTFCYWCKSENNRGENHPSWTGGLNERLLFCGKQEYKNWRINVFKRDNFKCVCCGNKKQLEAHHLYGFSEYPVARIIIGNGITLCKNCHNTSIKNSFHNLYGTKDFCPEDLYEYIQRCQSGEFKNLN